AVNSQTTPPGDSGNGAERPHVPSSGAPQPAEPGPGFGAPPGPQAPLSRTSTAPSAAGAVRQPPPRPVGVTNSRATPDPPMPREPMSSSVGSATPVPGRSGVRPTDGTGAMLMEQKRITPRSPRAALEPEQIAVPTRRSKRARNPCVIIGNAVFTLLI